MGPLLLMKVNNKDSLDLFQKGYPKPRKTSGNIAYIHAMYWITFICDYFGQIG